MARGEVNVRVAGAGDFDAILEVCSAALGWSQPAWDRALFAWKHSQSPFGESIVLIAEDDSGILSVRPLMMWRFSSLQGRITAARAVDTATRPDSQGRGLFRRTTEASIDVLRSRNIGFVFNTPNEESRPGYLSMGWHEAGPVQFGIRIRSVGSLPRVVRSKVAATKPSVPTPELGLDAGEWLRLLPRIPDRAGRRWRTDHDLDSLLWRYSGGPVSYRALPMGAEAGAIVRVRLRGHARELLVADQIGEVDEDVERRTLTAAMRTVRATHLIGAARTPGTIVTDRVGPTLLMREVSSYSPVPTDMAWATGDLELF